MYATINRFSGKIAYSGLKYDDRETMSGSCLNDNNFWIRKSKTGIAAEVCLKK
jgi:hypothetical protein